MLLFSMIPLLENLDSHFFLRTLVAAVDIALVAYLIYRLILLARPTRAWQILIGLLVFFGILYLSKQLGFMTLHWVLRQITPLGPVAIVILLYPELRHLLEELGRFGFWGAPLHVGSRREDMTATIEEVVRAAALLSPRKTGALIVLERETGLADITSSGIALDAEVSTELLATLFHAGTPLHDGAVIVRGGRIVAAGCTLPLSDAPNIATNVHTRHRAALGVSEQSDAAVVVVSEETGTISLAMGGKLIRGLKDDTLRRRLNEAFGRRAASRSERGIPLPFGRRGGAATENGAPSGRGETTVKPPGQTDPAAPEVR
jgi:diadenylate cyclase